MVEWYTWLYTGICFTVLKIEITQCKKRCQLLSELIDKLTQTLTDIYRNVKFEILWKEFSDMK